VTAPTDAAASAATGADPFRLDGRTALVTGGNQGLGKAFAFALARAGARVAVAARHGGRTQEVVDEAAAQGLELVRIDADLTVDADVERTTAEALEGLGGRLDVLVNNAGTCFHRASWDVPDEEWSAVFDLNVRALWKQSLSVGRHMREAGGGSIVNIGSISALIVNRPQLQPAYNASKAAVHQLTKSLAAEWAEFGIRVNALAPGYVRTDMAPVDEPRFRERWIEDAPQKRAADPEEIAPSVVFLASDAAAFITGTVLVADGGYTLY
jgi:NAD(P)-dependent dehydrogenase (short-subunit alcohol dehydrogenase family)